MGVLLTSYLTNSIYPLLMLLLGVPWIGETQEIGLLQANHPICPGTTGFYYEITVVSEGVIGKWLAYLGGRILVGGFPLMYPIGLSELG
jgi:hypothetical protein